MISPTVYAPGAARGWRPWGALVPFLGIGFVAATVISLTAVLQDFHLVDAGEKPIGLTGFIAFLLLPFAALAVLVLAWVRYVERRPMATIGLTEGGARKFLFGLAIGVGMIMALVGGIWIAGGMHAQAYGPAFGSPAGLAGIAILLACFAFQSSVEELVFRGWMLSAIAEKFGVPIAIALSSLVFTFLHFDRGMTPIFVANVILFAVFGCCFALSRGNVWCAMGWHGGWNWLVGTGFHLRVTALDTHMPALLVTLIPRGPDYLTGGNEGPEGSIMCTLVLIAGTLVTGWRVRLLIAGKRNPA